MSDCMWKPVLPNGHTAYSWNVTTEIRTKRNESTSITESKISANIIRLRTNKSQRTANKSMKPLTKNMFICKFCHDTLRKRSACFTPKCYYWSRPVQIEQKTSSRNNNKYKYKLFDDRSKWYRFKGIVSYDGYDFYGWQSQLNVATIQDLLEWRLSQYFKCKISVVGCSRTDAKVHANNQVFHCDLPIYKHKHLLLLCEKEMEQFIQKILNSLTKSIHVKSMRYVTRNFHARFCCFGKKYIYSIIQKERCKPSEMRYNLNINENNRKILDIGNMRIASKMLIGVHDFTAFAVRNDKNKIYMASHRGEIPTPIKHMKRIEIVTSEEERNVFIHIICSSFLYKMARSIAGTLIEIGFNNLSVKQFDHIFKSQKRTKEIVTAPAHGLANDKIYYDKTIWDNISNE